MEEIIGRSRRDIVCGAMVAGGALLLSRSADATVAPSKITKVLTAVARRPEIPIDEIVHEWTVTHANLGRSVYGVQRFVANVVKLEPGRSDVPDMMVKGLVDGFAEIWFDSELLPLIGSTPEGKRWYAHGAQLFGATHSFRAEEIIVW